MFYFSTIFIVVIKITEQNLTIPKNNYENSIKIENRIYRLNHGNPLSDQKNEGHWKLLLNYSDEFDDKKLNEEKWYPNNLKWKGRPLTYFHCSNISLEIG